MKNKSKLSLLSASIFFTYIPVVMELAHQGLFSSLAGGNSTDACKGGRWCSDLESFRNKHAAISMCWGFENTLAMVFQSINLTVWGVHLEFGKPEGLYGQPATSIIFQVSLWSFLFPVLALFLICLMTLNKALSSKYPEFWMFSDQLYS